MRTDALGLLSCWCRMDHSELRMAFVSGTAGKAHRAGRQGHGGFQGRSGRPGQVGLQGGRPYLEPLAQCCLVKGRQLLWRPLKDGDRSSVKRRPGKPWKAQGSAPSLRCVPTAMAFLDAGQRASRLRACPAGFPSCFGVMNSFYSASLSVEEWTLIPWACPCPGPAVDLGSVCSVAFRLTAGVCLGSQMRLWTSE